MRDNITAEAAVVFKIGVHTVNRLGFGAMRVTGAAGRHSAGWNRGAQNLR
jgi:hypothetical protein